MDGELLTEDEKLLRIPRWQGVTQDVPTAIRSLAKVHHLADDLEIDESANWENFVREWETIIRQLKEAHE